MMFRVLGIAAAGAIGSLARYWLSTLVQRWANTSFPFGTFAVNIIGSFLFGLIWALGEERFVISTEARIIALTGFMGAFTTFSTFAFETSQFLRDSQWLLAGVNVAAQVITGLIAMFVGLRVAQLF